MGQPSSGIHNQHLVSYAHLKLVAQTLSASPLAIPAHQPNLQTNNVIFTCKGLPPKRETSNSTSSLAGIAHHASLHDPFSGIHPLGLSSTPLFVDAPTPLTCAESLTLLHQFSVVVTCSLAGQYQDHWPHTSQVQAPSSKAKFCVY